MTHQNIFKFQGNPAAGLPWDLEKIGGLGGLVWNIEIFSGLPWVRWVNLELRKKQGNPASGLPRWTGYISMFQTNPPNPPIFSKSQGNPVAGLPWNLETM